MNSKRIRPDPWDYQLIQCSNALQCISLILDIAAAFFEQLREAALIVDIIVPAPHSNLPPA